MSFCDDCCFDINLSVPGCPFTGLSLRRTPWLLLSPSLLSRFGFHARRFHLLWCEALSMQIRPWRALRVVSQLSTQIWKRWFFWQFGESKQTKRGLLAKKTRAFIILAPLRNDFILRFEVNGGLRELKAGFIFHEQEGACDVFVAEAGPPFDF